MIYIYIYIGQIVPFVNWIALQHFHQTISQLPVHRTLTCFDHVCSPNAALKDTWLSVMAEVTLQLPNRMVGNLSSAATLQHGQLVNMAGCTAKETASWLIRCNYFQKRSEINQIAQHGTIPMRKESSLIHVEPGTLNGLFQAFKHPRSAQGSCPLPM